MAQYTSGEMILDEAGEDPDLVGIKKMLQTVNFNNFNAATESELYDENGLAIYTDTVLTISKLNPYVEEFIPKNSIEPKTDEKNKLANNNNNDDLNRMTSNEKQINIDRVGNMKETVTLEKMHHEKVNEIGDKLRRKISRPSKTESVQKKIERNLAIAALMKLYSYPTAPRVLEETKCPDLKEPDLIEKCIAPESATKVICPNLKLKFETTKTFSVTNKNVDRTPVDTNLVQEANESVVKVHNWLNTNVKAKPKEPTLCLGPVTFKKKEGAKPKSFSKTVVNENVSNAFIPSEYAETIIKEIKDRTNDRQRPSDHNIWSKLEKDLKERDKQILEGLKRQRGSQSSLT